MTTMFQYNQDSAITSGESSYINQSGAYVGRITAAKWINARQSQAQALELSFESQNGQKANFISLYHTKADGSPNAYGIAHINAIMGLTGLQALTNIPKGSDNICPELINKPIGFVLQKVLFNKANGEESYKFELIFPYGAKTGKTLKEAVNNEPAERVNQVIATLHDKDERDKSQGAPQSSVPQPPQRQATQPAAPVSYISDDIPL